MNFADPMSYKNFALALQLINEEELTLNRRMIINKPELENVTVNVNVRGLQSDLESLVSDQTIFAYVDLHSSELVNVPITRLNEPIPVRIVIGFAGDAQDADLMITNISRGMVDIQIERIENRTITPRAIYNETDLPAGYVLGDIEVEPNSVTVTGSTSIISQIFRIGVLVDLTEARTDVEDERPLVALNRFDDVVTGFDISHDTMRFKIPVYKTNTAQIQMSAPSYTGSPASSVVITETGWEPRTVELIGHVDEVDHIQAIVLDPADVSGITETAVFEYNINDYLKKINEERGMNVTLNRNEPDTVKVTFVTEPLIVREFIIPIDRIHVSGESSLGNRRRQMLSESVAVVLSGTESVINAILIEDIICRVYAAHLAELPDGQYTLEVDIITPAGTQLSGSPPDVSLLLTTTGS